MSARLRGLLGCSLLLLAGCGDTRAPVPAPTQPAAPAGFHTLTLSHAGVRLSAPRNWTVSGQPAPLVVTLESGTAVVALWRYPSAAPAPSGPAGLAQARQALLAAVRRRDPQVKLLGSSFSTVSGAAAIQVQAREQIAGRTRRVSSTHVYVRGAELVLDEYAPPAQFATVDRAVFVPVRQSLTLLPTGGA